MPHGRIEDLKPHDRRRFFLEGLGRAIGPIADYIEDNLHAPTARTLLRPPGALDEGLFLDTCYRCGSCVEACPAGAIRQVQTDDPAQAGTPYIDPDVSACVVCDAGACMNTCPSGALRVVKTTEFAMGLAQVRPEACLLDKDQPCGLCVEKCPMGQAAIRLSDAGRIEILEPGCIGCGVCQHQCPTTPKAIVVTP